MHHYIHTYFKSSHLSRVTYTLIYVRWPDQNKETSVENVPANVRFLTATLTLSLFFLLIPQQSHVLPDLFINSLRNPFTTATGAWINIILIDQP